MTKSVARKIFGKINQITVDKPIQRSMLFKYGVLAFENLKAKQNLDALENVTGENIVEFGKVFSHLDDLEASLYHQIVKGRINVVRALHNKVENDAKEKVIQKHLFDHLWLLDPSWERATATEYMEQQVATEFSLVTEKLTEEERNGRIDIKYLTTAGKHVIVELKRASVLTNTQELLGQITLYRDAMQKILLNMGKDASQIDIVCVVGRDLKDWSNHNGKKESEDLLKVKGARVVLYDQLIENAFKAYEDFLEKSDQAGRVFRLLSSIDETLDA